jgi:hypothetical protein
MPMSGPPVPASPARSGLAAVLRTVVLAAILLLPVAFLMGAFDRIGTASRTGGDWDRTGSAALQGAARHLRSLPARTGVLALAAEATPEGHWRFISVSGEVITAGTPEEMKRAIPLLHPEAKGSARVVLYLTEDTVIRQAAAVRALPANADLHVFSGAESYRLVRRTDGPVERFFAEVRPSLVVEIADQRLFRETVWQLERPLRNAAVRVLALEPGGPSSLSGSPRLDAASRRPLVDTIDPATLPAGMHAVSGQTLLLTGRIERDLMYFKPSSGPERSLALKDLFKAAEAADVNLLVLHAASTPRQPGGRNWLWQRVEVAGLEEGLERSRLADFLNGLGAPSRRMLAIALPLGGRALLDLTPAGDLSSAPPAATRGLGDLFAGIVAELTGRVVASGVKANLRSAERQQELDQRLLPGVPSAVQFGYLGLMLLGLLGVPLSRSWWMRLWPPEVAAEYAGRTGFWAARAVRALAYALIFLPLTAIVAAPHNLAVQIWDGITAPARWWRRLAGGARAPRAPLPAAGPQPAVGASGHPPATPTSSDRDWPTLEAPRFPRRPTR